MYAACPETTCAPRLQLVPESKAGTCPVDGPGALHAAHRAADLPLWEALAAQLQAFEAEAPMACTVSFDLPGHLPAPAGAFADAVQWVLSQMLDNVVRHARATEVLVRVRASHSDLSVLVRDNGRGAPPSTFERPCARGVQGMRERAAEHGGWLQIDSDPGRGTQVILSMPMRMGSLLHTARAAA
jgi:signal transduction histidine kinase